MLGTTTLYIFTKKINWSYSASIYLKNTLNFRSYTFFWFSLILNFFVCFSFIDFCVVVFYSILFSMNNFSIHILLKNMLHIVWWSLRFTIILPTFEPAHEIMALFVLRKLILQTRMRSHPVGQDVWFLVGPFLYFHTSCVRTAKALVRLHRCTGLPEPSLVAYVISTIISWAGSFVHSDKGHCAVCFFLLEFHSCQTSVSGSAFLLRLNKDKKLVKGLIL